MAHWRVCMVAAFCPFLAAFIEHILSIRTPSTSAADRAPARLVKRINRITLRCSLICYISPSVCVLGKSACGFPGVCAGESRFLTALRENSLRTPRYHTNGIAMVLAPDSYRAATPSPHRMLGGPQG